MTMTTRSLSAVASLLTLMPCLCARASFPSLAERLPSAVDAVIAVNVDKVLSSPLATKEGWRADLQKSWEKEPMMIPPGAQRILYVSSLKKSTMEPYWEISLTEMNNVPSAEDLASAEGGHVDKVWDKMAAYSPINAYFVPLDKTTLASITPAERSEIARWVRQPLQPGGAVKSDYIRDVVAGLNDGTDIVMAIDLDGAFGVPEIRKFIADQDIKEIPEAKRDPAAQLLGTLKGLTLDIRVDTEITGRVVVQLDGETSDLLDAAAKPIMIAVMDRAGMHLEDLKSWTFKAQGKQVVGEGKLTRAALRELLSIVQSPIPAATNGANTAGGKQAPLDPAAASQRYYKTICGMLDAMSPGASAGDTAAWLRNSARRIDQLPILNVDPALLEWGGMVSSKLKQAASVMYVGQTQITARAAGVADPEFGGSWDNQGNYHSDFNSTVASNVRKQRQQATLEQKSQAQERALDIANSIAETRPKIRAEMTQKYQVEF